MSRSADSNEEIWPGVTDCIYGYIKKLIIKKVRCKIKNVKSHLFTTSGSWSSSWNVFSARPLVVSMNPLGQYSHWII